jgi:hypothetical protein
MIWLLPHTIHPTAAVSKLSLVELTDGIIGGEKVGLKGQ